MGAYLRKPVTEKVSCHGEYVLGGRRLVYAATAMQGWRVSMEDAHSIIPRMDEETSLFAVYDGHGGKEVALYCANYLVDIIKSTEAYKTGHLKQALKDAFMECDHQLLTKDAIEEMKRMIQQDLPEEDSGDEQHAKLLEEADMPLETLFAQYTGNGGRIVTELDDDKRETDIPDGDDDHSEGEQGVKSMLQILASKAGFEIEFEDSDSSGDSEFKEGSEEEEEDSGTEDPEDSGCKEETSQSVTTELDGRLGGSEDQVAPLGNVETMDNFRQSRGSEEEASEVPLDNFRRSRGSEKETSEVPLDDFRQLRGSEKETSEVPLDDFRQSRGSEEEASEVPLDDFRRSRGSEEEASEVPLDDFRRSRESEKETSEVPLDDFRQSRGSEECSPVENVETTTNQTTVRNKLHKGTLERSSKSSEMENSMDYESKRSDHKAVDGTVTMSLSTRDGYVHERESGRTGLANPSNLSVCETSVRECNSADEKSDTQFTNCSSSSATNGSVEISRPYKVSFSAPSTSETKKKSPGLVDLLTSTLEQRESRTWSVETAGSVTVEKGDDMRNLFAPPSLSQKRSHPKDEEDLVLEEGSPLKRVCQVEDAGYHSGTTAVVCLLRRGTLIVANAGDSRCVLSSNGVAVDMSIDHKPTDPLELERIERAGGKVGADSRVNGGLNLSRALGDHFYKENRLFALEDQMISAMPDIQTRRLTRDDEFIIVGCDGIWNAKSSQEVVDFVKVRLLEDKGHSEETQRLTTICEALCDSCLAPDTNNDGTGCDNVTCILILLNQSQSPPQ